MKKVELRDIFLPDGSTVEEGKTVYLIEAKEISNYASPKYFAKGSGEIAHYLVEYTVAKVNKAENQRSFVLRSDRGCEETYYVKNNCLPDIFSDKGKAISRLKSKEIEKHCAGLDGAIVRLKQTILQKQEKIRAHQATKKKILDNLKKLK